MKTFQQFISEAYFHLDEERVPVRKRGGVSAPEGERSIGGEANRRNKDYWASVVGRNRDRGMGSKAKRRAAELNKEEVEIEEGIGMTVANALGNPPALSKRMKLKQALVINKIKSDAKKNAGKKYSGKAATSEEYEN
jgi:hypothetical protein